MAIIRMKQELNKEELKSRGIILYRKNNEFYVKDMGMKFRKRGDMASMAPGDGKDSSETADYNLKCPYCGSNIISMDMSIPTFLDSIRCNNRKCKKDVGMFELIAINETAVKNYMNDNFVPTKKYPVIDPDFEFEKIMKSLKSSRCDIN